MEKRLFFLVNQAQGLLYKSVDRDCIEATGIPAVQSAALLALEKNDGCSLSWLRKTLKINKSSMGALTERMERNKIIERRTDPEDARVTRIHITTQGRKILIRLKPLLIEHNQRLRAGFSDQEMEIVVKFLNHIVQSSS